MKIIIPVFAFGKGGGNRVLSKLANHWIQMNHEVCFISFANSITPYFKTTAEIFWIDEQGRRVTENLQHKVLKINKIKQIFILRKAIERLAIDADIILANGALTAYSVKLAKIKAEKNYYIQANEADYEFHYSTLKHKIMGALCFGSYKLGLKVIVNSPIYYNLYGMRAVSYIPPGIDYAIFKPERKENARDSFIIGCIGRFEKFKGTIFVYDAFVKLRSRGIPVKLKIAYADLNGINLKFKDDIIFCTPKDDNELSDFYNSIDVLVSPGTIQYYAHHYPVMEAMACKTPTITTAYLPADLSNSWLVAPMSSEQIVAQVLNIMENPTEVGQKIELAYQNIQVYKWEVIASKFIEVFTNK